MVHSLYAICIAYIVKNNEELDSFGQLPFKPFVYDIIYGLFKSEKPIQKHTLSIIGKQYGQQLTELPPAWTTVCVSLLSPVDSSVVALNFLSTQLSSFIVRLDLSHTDIEDKHIHLLNRFQHLQTLELCHVNCLSDIGLLYLSNMAKRLPALKRLYLTDNPGITDKSLSHLSKLTTLESIDVSNTLITESVACFYLKSLGYVQMERRPEHAFPFARLHRDIRNMLIDQGGFMKRTSQRRGDLCYEKTMLYFERSHALKRGTEEEEIVESKKVRRTLDDYLTLISNEFLND